MWRNLCYILLIIHSKRSLSSDFCVEKLPGLGTPPSKDHSNPDEENVEASVSLCKKHRNDKFYVCNCFDDSNSPLEAPNANKKATKLCCQCPEILVREYVVFKNISFGDGQYAMPTAKSLLIDNCEIIRLSNGVNLEDITVTNTTDLTIGRQLGKLTTLKVSGRSPPNKAGSSKATEISIQAANTRDKASFDFTNTVLKQLPSRLNIEKMTLTTSEIDLKNEEFKNAKLNSLEIINSSVVSMFDSGLPSYNSPVLLTNSRISSTCQPQTNSEPCFLKNVTGTTLTSNTILCTCDRNIGSNCKDQEHAITKLPCSLEILANFTCSDLSPDPLPIPLKYLKENINETKCQAFEREYDLLTTSIKDGGNPDFPPASGLSTGGKVGIALVILAILGATVLAIKKISTMKMKRKMELYKEVPQDKEPEGVPMADDEDD